MSKDNKKKHDQEAEAAEKQAQETTQEKAEATGEQAEKAEEQTEKAEAKEETADEKIARLEKELEKEKKEYLFLMADFDNYRKRTLKEKQDLVKNGCEKALADILPVVDDFDRALATLEKADDIDAMREGVELIYKKFIKYLDSYQVKAMESTGKEFNTDLHEAVTTFPAPSDDDKGKVIDTVLKGYTLNDRVLRHAKVVVGQ